MSKTLNDYIPLLRGPQQDYIVHCVQQYSGRGDQFHRGLLPFLPAEEAARCLLLKLEELKATQNQASNFLEAGEKAILGDKFIRQIISVFRNALIYRLADNETSEVIYLSTVKLKKAFGKRFGKKFYLTGSDIYISVGNGPIDSMFELQMISRNKWKVSGRSDWIHWATKYLHDIAPL